MMYEVVGKERFTGSSRKTGKAYDFTRLYCQLGEPVKTCIGNRTESIDIWATANVDLDAIGVGSRIQVFYNKRGYVDTVDVID